MSICIYPVDPEQLRARLSVAVQKQPLAPFPTPRLRPAPWQLNRLPLTFRTLTVDGWAARLELGEELGEQPGTAEPTTEPGAAAPRAPSAPRAIAGPETLAYAWHITLGGAGGVRAASTPAIPWPFRITGFTITQVNNVAGATWIQLQLYATDANYSGQTVRPPETPLLQPVSGFLNGWDHFGATLRRVDSTVNVAPQPLQALAQSVLGTTVRDPNKRLTIALLDEFATGDRWDGTVTVERLDSTAGVATRPSAVPLQVNPPPAVPAAAPCRPPSYGSLDYWRNQLATAQRMPAIPYWTAKRTEAENAIRCLTQQQTTRTGPDLGPVSTPAQATANAELLRARGETARAAVYSDMARRMERGYALTPAQEALLTYPGAYQPTILGLAL